MGIEVLQWPTCIHLLKIYMLVDSHSPIFFFFLILVVQSPITHGTMENLW